MIEEVKKFNWKRFKSIVQKKEYGFNFKHFHNSRADIQQYWLILAKRSIDKGLPFNLSTKDIENLVLGTKCAYCDSGAKNLLFSVKGKKKRAKVKVSSRRRTGLDRVDNNRGYVKGNVVPCCWECNQKKGTKSPEDFTQIEEEKRKTYGIKNRESAWNAVKKEVQKIRDKESRSKTQRIIPLCE